MKADIRTGIGLTAFETAWGWVGFAWSELGLVAVTLPQPTREAVLDHLPRSKGPVPAPPPGLDLAVLAHKLQRYFEGQAVDFNEPLDLNVGTEFQRQVWAITRSIPRGQTLTYAEVAARIGSPQTARAVGQALARNPWPVIVPCHRVVGQGRRLTGFGGGLEMKRQMLKQEGVSLAFEQ